MLNLSSFSTSLCGSLSSANIGLLYEMLQGFLCISHGGGVRTVSRYMKSSEPSIFRFIAEAIAWQGIFVRVFRSFLYDHWGGYLLAADETVEGKSGKSSFGRAYFDSSILQKVIPSVCLFSFSLIEVSSEKSYHLGFEQVVYNEGDRVRIAAQKTSKVAGKGKAAGRRKGTKKRIRLLK